MRCWCGFKLYAVRPGSAFARIGLTNGDTIVRVNGYDLNSPDHSLEAYSRLHEAKNIVIELIRENRVMFLETTLPIGRNVPVVEQLMLWRIALQQGAFKAPTRDTTLRWIAPRPNHSSGCIYSTGPDRRAATADDVRFACDLQLLNPHLLIAAALDCARDRIDAFGNDISVDAKDGVVHAWSAGADQKADTADDPLAVAVNARCR